MKKLRIAVIISTVCVALTILSSCHSRYSCPTYGKTDVKIENNC